MKKHGFKNLFTGLVSSALVFSLCVAPVFATEGKQDAVAEISVNSAGTEITPMGAICAQCGKGILITSTTWANWYTTGQVDCTHGHAWGVDLVQERKGIKTTTCNVCDKGRS